LSQYPILPFLICIALQRYSVTGIRRKQPEVPPGVTPRQPETSPFRHRTPCRYATYPPDAKSDLRRGARDTAHLTAYAVSAYNRREPLTPLNQRLPARLAAAAIDSALPTTRQNKRP